MVSIALISLTTVIFGVAALLLASKARSRLSPGSIRSYIDNFSICLAFIVLFSLWQTVRTLSKFDLKIMGFSDYPELIFIGLAYVAFIITSFRVIKISEEFGFVKQGKKIDKIITSKKRKKKRG